MKIISNSRELQVEFNRLLQNYNNYYWAVAWSDFDFEQCHLLIKNIDKIKKISVGLAFYATNIRFIKKFKSHKGVNFVINDKGTYHPKVYIFENNKNEFEILIGSANFTNGAFNKNTEFSILISSKDKDSQKIFDDSMDFINKQWDKGVVLSTEFITKYAAVKDKIEPTPKIPKTGTFKPIYSKSWQQYLKDLQNVPDYKGWIETLNWVQDEFIKQPIFHKMKPEIRKAIAGFAPAEGVATGCFGSTGARGFFKQSIIDKPKIITEALSKIPKVGVINKENYINFIKEFKKVSKNNELACATRFLCLWRPDYFVNFNGKNADSLSKELRISKSKVNYETYWDLIVVPLNNAEWSKTPKFKSNKEKDIFSKRIALLDCIHADL